MLCLFVGSRKGLKSDTNKREKREEKTVGVDTYSGLNFNIRKSGWEGRSLRADIIKLASGKPNKDGHANDRYEAASFDNLIR